MCFWLNCLHQVVDKTKNITEIPEWFAGSRLNYAENLLRCKDSNKTAIIECGTCVYVCVYACGCVCIRMCVRMWMRVYTYVCVCINNHIYIARGIFYVYIAIDWTWTEIKSYTYPQILVEFNLKYNVNLYILLNLENTLVTLSYLVIVFLRWRSRPQENIFSRVTR